MNFKNDPRFKDLEPFDHKVWLSSPTMHGDEQLWVDEAIRSNWVSTVGENIDAVEKMMAEYVFCQLTLRLQLKQDPLLKVS